MSEPYVIQQVGTSMTNAIIPEKPIYLLALQDNTFFIIINKYSCGSGLLDAKGSFIKGPISNIRKKFKDHKPKVTDVLSMTFPLSGIKFIQNLTFQAISA